MIVRWAALFCRLVAIFLIAGCAVSAGHHTQNAANRATDPVWQGRLAVHVPADPTHGEDQDQRWSSNFVLRGHSDLGELQLLTPFGITTADIAWTPKQAVLRTRGDSRSFDHIDALISDVVGITVPIDALLAWLDGNNLPVDGWTVDLTGFADGKIVAMRNAPAPQAEIRIVLDR